MSNIFFTSDPHLGHPLLSKLRGFELPSGDPDTAAHDNWYIKMWHEHISDRDLVFVLGDLTVGGAEKVRYALGVMSRLPGRKVFISGNHDATHPAHRTAAKRETTQAWAEVFEAVHPFAARRIMVGGQRRELALSHFPLFGDHTDDDRFDEWRLKDSGRWHLHGHTHNASQRVHDGKQLHVGIDAWGRPLSEVEVASIITAVEAGKEHDVPYTPLLRGN